MHCLLELQVSLILGID